MNKKDRKAIKVVLDELHQRIPKSKKKGFVLDGTITDAVEHLLTQIQK